MDLVLHIGCEKTGTTSIQNWLDQNSTDMIRHGVMYSRTLGRSNNRRIALYGMEPGRMDELLLQDGAKSPDEHAALQKRVKNELTAEVQDARRRGVKKFVISNEHLQSRCFRDENVERVRDLLVPLFDTVEVYCFLRPQIDVCLSLASTMARNGGEVSRRWIDDLLRPKLPYFDLHQLMDRWSRFFGREAMVPVAFKRCPDIISYFERRLDLVDAALPRKKSFNEALDYRVIAMCNAMGMKSIENSQVNQSRRFFINDLPVEERLSLDRDSAQAFQSRFDDTNAQLCAKWAEITQADMTPDWSRYPDVGNVDKLMELQEFGPFLRYVVERFNHECWWHQARWAAATSEREAMAARFETGIRAAEFGMMAAKNAIHQPLYAQKAERLIENLELRLIRLRRRRDREQLEMRQAEAEQTEEEEEALED